MVCQKCGYKPESTEAAFCEKCGTPFHSSTEIQTPKKIPKVFILIGLGATVLIIAVVLIFFLRAGGDNNIIGTWEFIDDNWDDWRGRIVFDSNGTGRFYEIDIVTNEIYQDDADSFHWTVTNDVITISFINPWDPTDIYTNESNFRISRGITGERILGILDAFEWVELREIK